MVDWQSLAGSAALEKSMHSSRFDFSSLQTQHGYDDEESQHLRFRGTTKKERVSWVSGRKGGRTLGFEDASEVAGAGGCAIGPAAGMAGRASVSESRAGLRS